MSERERESLLAWWFRTVSRDSVGQCWPSIFHPCASSEVVLRESLQHGPYITLPQVSAASDLVTC